jgi:flavin-dependent dehydrogenase
MLVKAAEDAGAIVLTGINELRIRRGGEVWEVGLGSDKARSQVKADLLVVATGRSFPLGDVIPSQRTSYDRLVAVVQFLTLLPCEAPDRRTWIEAVENGWWYSALLPDDRLVAAFLTDADLLHRSSGEIAQSLATALSGAFYTTQRLKMCEIGAEGAPPRVVAADSYLRQPASGNGWFTAGDAAMALDPLSGQGIHRALLSGVSVAEAVLRILGDTGNGAVDTQEELNGYFAEYLAGRQHYYRQESRWPESPFWYRRHGVINPIRGISKNI